MIDAGASWIHGIGKGVDEFDDDTENPYNPIYEVAKENHITTVKTWNDIDSSTFEFIWYNGTRVNTAMVESLADKIETAVEDYNSNDQTSIE